MKTLNVFVILASIAQVLSLNHAPIYQKSHLGRESAASPTEAPSQEEDGESARKLGARRRMSFVRRNERNSNRTPQMTLLKDDKVESRIMNKPQPYPEFAVRSTQTEKENIPNTTPNPTEKVPVVTSELPALPTTTQSINGEFELNFPPPIPEDDTKLMKPRYAAGNRTSNPPKDKILPLQLYNKIIVNPVEPPSPVNNKQMMEQWTPCICIPQHLCIDGLISISNEDGILNKKNEDVILNINNEDGILNSNKVPRQLKSSAHSIGDKTYPYAQSKILSSPMNAPNNGICETDEICCELNSNASIGIAGGDNYFSVATSLPEMPPEPNSTFPPESVIEGRKCGVRSAYGMQVRLQQLRYSPDDAEFGEYPWQVAILKRNAGAKKSYLCAGVLISSQWVASVAHCFNKVQGSQVLDLVVRLGDWDVQRTDEMYPYIERDVVGGVARHPEFDPETLQNDVALMRLRGPVDPSTPHVTPACLPATGQVYNDQKCWVSGWGKDSYGPDGTYQNVLKEVDVPVVSRALCNTYLRSTNLGPDFVLHNGFLCAGGEVGKDACTGDGGSPLVCQSGDQWYVVGLVSWGLGCGKPGVPGVYVNVLYYADWINNIINR
ncbi:hypothetical protein JTE90_019131 [Oedothorax gibbosus]|uniref:Peptidase S1 domain-containing protein n=2 Tax=Oedothorax gibbosus TaxID=931172 RepID=A0AAV6TUL2_9ARAC|nr:hypothetical protein JTE90_019131 [Oedothorax gibbosus]